MRRRHTDVLLLLSLARPVGCAQAVRLTVHIGDDGRPCIQSTSSILYSISLSVSFSVCLSLPLSLSLSLFLVLPPVTCFSQQQCREIDSERAIILFRLFCVSETLKQSPREIMTVSRGWQGGVSLFYLFLLVFLSLSLSCFLSLSLPLSLSFSPL